MIRGNAQKVNVWFVKFIEKYAKIIHFSQFSKKSFKKFRKVFTAPKEFWLRSWCQPIYLEEKSRTKLYKLASLVGSILESPIKLEILIYFCAKFGKKFVSFFKICLKLSNIRTFFEKFWETSWFQGLCLNASTLLSQASPILSHEITRCCQKPKDAGTWAELAG